MEKKKRKASLDHYEVLGLPTGEEGAKLTEKHITKAYKTKALQLHPDKRPNDPKANAEFQKLKSSYDLLINPEARKRFDASLSRIANKPYDDLITILEKIHKAQRQRPNPKRETSPPEPSPSEPNNDTDGKEVREGEMYASKRQNSEYWPLLGWIFKVGRFFERQYYKLKPSTADNQQSQGDDHEDIEDWVVVW